MPVLLLCDPGCGQGGLVELVDGSLWLPIRVTRLHILVILLLLQPILQLLLLILQLQLLLLLILILLLVLSLLLCLYVLVLFSGPFFLFRWDIV